MSYEQHGAKSEFLSQKILATALKTLNHHYQQPVLATAEEFEAAIDEVIRTHVKNMNPLFAASELAQGVAYA